MRGRRAFLREVAAVAGVATAGCVSDGATGGTSPTGTPTGTGTPAGTGTPTASPAPPDVPDSLPDPTLGDPGAPVTVDAYEDFDCPYCRSYHETSFGRLRENYVETGEVRYVFHDSPKVSADSWRMAGAARAVQHDAGREAFWAFADALYGRESASLDAADLGRLAAETTGADGPFVRRVVEEGAFRAFLREQREAAVERGAHTVPTILVEGREVPWEYAGLSAAIDAEL